MVSTLFLAALLCNLACSGAVQPQCSLTNTQKFNPSCEDVVSGPPSAVFQGAEFTVNLHPQVFNGTLHVTSPTNASIFPSPNEFCDYGSYSEGVVCSDFVVVVSGLQNIALRLVCEDSQQMLLNFGPAVLVLGFPAPYACNVQLNITWGQSTLSPLHLLSTPPSPPLQHLPSFVKICNTVYSQPADIILYYCLFSFQLLYSLLKPQTVNYHHTNSTALESLLLTTMSRTCLSQFVLGALLVASQDHHPCSVLTLSPQTLLPFHRSPTKASPWII